MPTLAKSGVPGFEATAWYGVVAPAAVSKDIITKMNAEMLKVLKLPDIKQRFDEMGSDIVADTPEQFVQRINSETAWQGAVIKQAKGKLD